MITALFSAATGMDAQETNINVTANNLANVNTTGFKRSRANFQDLSIAVQGLWAVLLRKALKCPPEFRSDWVHG
jgi:flagellar hook protein FlgE